MALSVLAPPVILEGCLSTYWQDLKNREWSNRKAGTHHDGKFVQQWRGQPERPARARPVQGRRRLACRPVTFWDFVEGRDPELLP
jgi:hypothetical protein